MKPSIVFLHGLNCTSKIFSFLHSQLPHHTPIFVDYTSQQPLEDSYLQVLCKLSHRKPITVIGHSLGGVLGYMLATRSRLKITNLVTISSPFGGSQVAGLLKWFYPDFKILKDITPNSKVIREISEYAPKCPFLSLVSVRGHMPFISEPNDGVVSIASQTCVMPTKRVELDSNHFEAMQDMRAVEAIKEFLFK
jgi:pimeloyl-ACP methyl ester carboxylesterase